MKSTIASVLLLFSVFSAVTPASAQTSLDSAEGDEYCCLLFGGQFSRGTTRRIGDAVIRGSVCSFPESQLKSYDSAYLQCLNDPDGFREMRNRAQRAADEAFRRSRGNWYSIIEAIGRSVAEDPFFE